MKHSAPEKNFHCDLKRLICEVLYCRTEARFLRLDLVEYFLSMAHLELESLVGPADKNPGLLKRRRSEDGRQQ
jgi:hypothetical protein